MAFTFQINDSLRFRHDEALLARAEANKPVIHETRQEAAGLAELVEDPSWLGGWGITRRGAISDLAALRMKRDDTVILDFGRHVTGSFGIHIEKTGSPMDAPLYMRIRFAEMPCEFKNDSSSYEGWLSRSWIQEEFIHLDELPADLKLSRRYSFRYVEIKVIDTSPKWHAVFSSPFVIRQSSADETGFAPLKLNDPELQRIYDAGLRTLSECMQDVFEDGPKRDRRLWLGDLRLQALANYATYDECSLVKRCLYLFAAMTTEEGRISANVFVRPEYAPDDTFLFEYSLFFISVLSDYHHAHPDIELVRELYPVAKGQMDITLSMVDEDGQLHTTDDYPVFVDWSNDFNKDTAGQAEVISCLRQFLELARIAGEADIEKYQARLDMMCRYAKEKLFDQSRNLFVTAGGEYNIASQVWMVLANVMSPEENRTIMKQMVHELFPVKHIATPYMYHHISEALFEAGLKEEALRLMKQYWGKMISLGADTFWEAFDPDQPDYSPYGSAMVNSYCHAWSCTPVYLIKKYHCG